MRALLKDGLGTLLLWAGLGVLLGLGFAKSRPHEYEANLAIHFPNSDSETFRQILQAVRADAATNETLSLVPSTQDDSKRAELAREILFSRGATQAATQASGLPLSPEAVEAFRASALHLELRSGDVLEISVRDRSPEMARLYCHHYLEYYDHFVKTQALTHTGMVRKSLERRYLQMAAQLRSLEKKVVSRQQRTNRKIGDDLVVTNEETKALLARHRAEQEKSGTEVLQRLRNLRAELKTSRANELSGLPQVQSEDKDGISQTLGKESVTSQHYAEEDIPRPSDLISRVKLERNYEDTTALHRILLLQHGILRTLEELEAGDYTIIDPLTVHRRPETWFWCTGALIGASVGLAIGLISLSLQSSESDSI